MTNLFELNIVFLICLLYLKQMIGGTLFSNQLFAQLDTDVVPYMITCTLRVHVWTQGELFGIGNYLYSIEYISFFIQLTK